jgi:hypothetical protein
MKCNFFQDKFTLLKHYAKCIDVCQFFAGTDCILLPMNKIWVNLWENVAQIESNCI